MTFSPRLVHNIKVNIDAVMLKWANAGTWSTLESSHCPFSDLWTNCVKCIDFTRLVVGTIKKKYAHALIRNFQHTNTYIYAYISTAGEPSALVAWTVVDNLCLRIFWFLFSFAVWSTDLVWNYQSKKIIFERSMMQVNYVGMYIRICEHITLGKKCTN